MSRIIKARELQVDPRRFCITWQAQASNLAFDENAVANESDLSVEETSVPANEVELCPATDLARANDGDDDWVEPVDGAEENQSPEQEAALTVAAEIRAQAEALLDTARANAAVVAEQARTEAEKRVQAAEDVAAQLRAEAHDVGYAAGFAEGQAAGHEAGKAEAVEQMAASMQEAAAALEAALSAKADILSSSRADVVRIVGKIAEKIVRAELKTDSEAVERTIEAALKLAADRSCVTIRVNPDDLARARAGEAHFAKFLPPSGRLDVYGDARISPGGCVIDTGAGTIDARVEAELAELISQLEAALYAR